MQPNVVRGLEGNCGAGFGDAAGLIEVANPLVPCGAWDPPAPHLYAVEAREKAVLLCCLHEWAVFGSFARVRCCRVWLEWNGKFHEIDSVVLVEDDYVWPPGHVAVEGQLIRLPWQIDLY